MPSFAPPTSLSSVVLKDKPVSPAVLGYIPFDVAKKYQVVAFEENDTVLKLALVHPEQLKQGFFIALSDIGEKIHKKIELFKTDPASLQNALKQYDQKNSAPSAPSTRPAGQVLPIQVAAKPTSSFPKPPLFELGHTVAYNYLKRIPVEFARKHRILSVDFLSPNQYWFVTDGSNTEELKRIIPEIEKQNSIVIHNFDISKGDFDDLLKYYETLEKNEKQAKEEQDKKNVIMGETLREEAAADAKAQKAAHPEQAFKEKEVVLAKGVVEPDVQATIITSEEEKGGLAGLFQRVANSLSGQSNNSEDEKKKAEEVPVPPAPNAQNKPTAAPAPAPGPKDPAAPATMPAPPAPAPVNPAITPVATQTKAQATEDDGDIGKLLDKQVSTLEELKEHVKKGFIPRIVAAMVSYAIHEKASDIHIEAFEDEVRIRYRIDGQLIDIIKLPPDVQAAVVSRIKILSRLRLDENRVPQDGRFDVKFEDAQVDLRVSVMPTVHGEKVVLRILDKARGITSLEKLGVEGLAYTNLTKSIQKPYGICLATGPTGSGKSTSLYAILNRIATPNVNVVTLEDPVEYEIKGVNQSQIRPKIGYTFAEGLRSILRQDPNIIMVGEIRDGETANMATQAALTGHLVLSTLHTNDAAGAIPRLTNMGIEPFLITSSLNVAMGQRLVRKICQSCKKEVNMPQGLRDKFAKEIEEIERLSPADTSRVKTPLTFFQGIGCAQCSGKGYRGRLGIYEVLVMTEAIEDLTLNRASNLEIQNQAQKEGMLTMYQDGILKVINGITTLDEVLRETATK